MHTYSKPIDFIAGDEYWFLPSKISGVFISAADGMDIAGGRALQTPPEIE
jgi:hypothetical protein